MSKVIYEKAGHGSHIRVVACDTYHVIERYTGRDALGVERWERFMDQGELGSACLLLAGALAGEQANCARLAAEQHGAKMRAELAEINLRKMRAAVKNMLLDCTDMTSPDDEDHDACPADLVWELEKLLCADGNGGQCEVHEVIP